MNTYIDKIVDEVKTKANIKSDYLARYYALLVLTKGNNITLKDVHDAWAMSMNFKPKTDHCFGHEHKSIVPFDELNTDVQYKDKKFVEILNGIASSGSN